MDLKKVEVIMSHWTVALLKRQFRQWKAVSYIILISSIIFIVGFFISKVFSYQLYLFLGLSRMDLLSNFAIYQPITYVFLHGSFLHLAFNMFALWVFGREIEALFGTTKFLLLYFVAAVFGGLAHILFSEFYLIGASASVFAILLAYGITWPNRKILLAFIVPLKVKYFVVIVMIMEFILSLDSTMGDGVSHLSHIGGLLGGAIILTIYKKYNIKLKKDDLLILYRQRKNLKKEKKIKNEKEQVDRLLEKISIKGMKSLSRAEKSFLDKASKRSF